MIRRLLSPPSCGCVRRIGRSAVSVRDAIPRARRCWYETNSRRCEGSQWGRTAGRACTDYTLSPGVAISFLRCVCVREMREKAPDHCVSGNIHRTEQGRATVLCRTNVSGRDERQRGPSGETIFIFQDTRSKKTRAQQERESEATHQDVIAPVAVIIASYPAPDSTPPPPLV